MIKLIQRWWLPLFVLVLLLIWGNSLMPGNISSRISMKVQQLLSPILELLGVELGSKGHGLLRKLAHFTEFAALGALCALYGKQSTFGVRLPSLLLLGLTVGMVDETIQLFIAGRNSSVRDVWIDFAGFCVGLFFMTPITSLFKKE